MTDWKTPRIKFSRLQDRSSRPTNSEQRLEARCLHWEPLNAHLMANRATPDDRLNIGNQQQTGRSRGQPGRLTWELNARRDLERKAQAAREEIARLKGIRKEYGENRFKVSFRGSSWPTHSGTQQQPKLHGARRLSPLRAPQRNFDQVNPNNSCRGPHRSDGEISPPQKKIGVVWTAVHETNKWGFDSDSDGEWQDGYLFSSTDNPSTSLVGRSASPGPLPYGATKNV